MTKRQAKKRTEKWYVKQQKNGTNVLGNVGDIKTIKKGEKEKKLVYITWTNIKNREAKE